jgi:hypothetical protein
MRRLALLLLALPLAAFGAFDRFQALIAVDDGCKGRDGEAIFRIQVDGKEVYKSGVMLPGDEPMPLDIPIAGAKTLGLFIDDEGDGHGGDWGEWLDARLVDSKTGESAFLTDLVPEQKAWIWANIDRNIIQEPMRVNGVLFLRGWGCISGSEMVFRDWEKVIEEHEAGLDRANAEAAKRVGKVVLKCGADLPGGMTLSVDGKPVAARQLRAGVTLGPKAVVTVETDLSSAEHRRWWAEGSCMVVARAGEFALLDLVQPSERWLQYDYQPNRLVLAGEAEWGTEFRYGGTWYEAEGPVTVRIRDSDTRVERLSVAYAEKAAGEHLCVTANPRKTTEIGRPAALSSSLLTVLADGGPIAYAFSDNPRTYQQIRPFDGWPNKLECVTHPGADGSIADGFAFEVFVVTEGPEQPESLRGFEPSYVRFTYGKVFLGARSGAWLLPGSGVARWLDLPKLFEAKRAGDKLCAELADALKGATTVEEIEVLEARVLEIDPRNAEVRMAAARAYEKLDPQKALREWVALVEVARDEGHTGLAKQQVDELWTRIDPAPLVYPDDGSGTRANRFVARRQAGPEQPVGRICVGRPGEQGFELSFPAPEAERLGLLVNSLGVEVTASVRHGERQLASRTERNPFLDLDLSAVPAGEELILRVESDPDVTGLHLDHPVEVTAWIMESDEDLPREDWELALNPDGSAEVSRTSRVPVLAAIPRSATDLRVENGIYTLQEPATELLVDWDGRLGAVNLPLFAVPDQGKEMTISYHWPDAAYNVPMSKWAWGRLDHVYLRTPSAILDTKRNSTWRVTRIPDGWKATRWTPEPSSEAPLTFDVVPTQGLDAEFEARDVLTRWMCVNHENLYLFVPDNPNNRRWLPIWMKSISAAYDKQVQVSGYEKPRALYVGVQGASQLSGYGGATIGDEHMSESWVASTVRSAPCFWRHSRNPGLVDSHELHWVHFGCFPPEAPNWAIYSFGPWLEEMGWRATGFQGCEGPMREHLANLQPALELIREQGSNPLQSNQEQWDALPGPTQNMMISLGWHITNTIYETYGEDIWARFWKEQRDKYSDLYPVLSERAKQILNVDELVRITGDPSLRDRFENEWLFDLTPDPQDLPDRFLILPRSPKISAEDDPDASKPAFDDTAWDAASGPGVWNDVGAELKGHRGVAWYRFTFDVPADFKTENLEIVLGSPGAADEAYFNGERIGATGKFPPDGEAAYDVERVYKLQARLLKPGGRNVLAVRVFGSPDRAGMTQRPRLVSRIGK